MAESKNGLEVAPPVGKRQLKVQSKFWTDAKWESYLKTLETPRNEALLEHASSIEQFSSGRTPWDFIASPAPSVDEQAARHLRSAIKTLSPQERKVIRLKFWRGLFPVAISRRLKISEAAVRIYLTRALDKIERKMATLRLNDTFLTKTSRPLPLVGSPEDPTSPTPSQPASRQIDFSANFSSEEDRHALIARVSK